MSQRRPDVQFARRVMLGLALVGAVAIIGPLISYRSDVHEMAQQLEVRISREGEVHAQALALHIKLLEAELERVASRPEIDFRDGTDSPEQEILDFTHRPHSALFEAGVLLVDASGRPVVTLPKNLATDLPQLASRSWFQRVLTTHAPVVDALAKGSHTLAVAVPIQRGDAIIGALCGLVDVASQELAGARATGENHELIVVDPSGDVLLPVAAPAWASDPKQVAAVQGQLYRPSPTVELSGKRYFVAVNEVSNTGLKLALMADERAVVAPIRVRLLAQLFFIAVIQVLTLLLFSLYLRRSYRAFLQMESRAAEQEKLAALGSAASLIAHEVKNSLNGMSAAATLLTEGGDPALGVKTIRGQTDRLKHLATSLLHFGKPASAQLVPVSLDQLVSETIESLKVLPEAEEVTVRADVQAPIQVRCDPLLLATALDNLIRNAIEAAVAAKDSGVLAAPEVRVQAGAASGQAYVTVEDNAGGPPHGLEGRLFEPFVTGKPKGIGLGLSMARRAVEQQGGSLAFERTAFGSRFTVRLALGTA